MDAVILNYRAGKLQQFASAMRDRFTAVILNYRANRLQQFASAMRGRFTAKKGKYEIVFMGDGYPRSLYSREG